MKKAIYNSKGNQVVNDDYLEQDDDYFDVPDRYPDEIDLEAESNRAETEYFNR